MKKNLFQRYKFLLFSIAIIIVGICIETSYFNPQISERHFKSFQKVIIEKQNLATKLCNQIISLEPDDYESYELFSRNNKRTLDYHQISFYVFNEGKIIYWSDNTLNPNIELFNSNDNILYTGNAWYLIEHQKKDQKDFYLLTFIKSQYSFKNEYIHNEFHPDFNIDDVDLFNEPCEDTYTINDKNGEFLLSIQTSREHSKNHTQFILAIILYILGFAFLLLFCNDYINALENKQGKIISFFLITTILLVLRYLMIDFNIPYICYSSELFTSQNTSLITSSLGDILISVMILTFVVSQIIHNVHSKFLTAFLLSIFWIFCCYCFDTITLHTTINFELFNLLNVNALTFIAYAIIALLLFLYFALLYSFINSFSSDSKSKNLLAIAICIAVSFTGILFPTPHFWYGECFFIATIILFLILKSIQKLFLNNALKLVALFMSVIFIEILVAQNDHKNKIEQQKKYAVELANEQDPVAETSLAQVYKSTRKDKTLREMMQNPTATTVDSINAYLQKTYFGGFLQQYELECTVCGNGEEFGDINTLDNCESYFKQSVSTGGKKISDTTYYYINNQDGRITYFDSIQYNFANGKITKLYIELHSEKTTQEYGYPNILLDERISQKQNKFSSAKYKNKQLVSKQGSCPYSTYLEYSDTAQFATLDDFSHRYEHIAYTSGDEFTVVVSARKLSWTEYLMWFPYIFMYFFVLMLLFTRCSRNVEQNIEHTLSLQIRHTLIGLLFGSFIILGTSYILFNNMRNDRQQRDFLEEKMQSVATEFTQLYSNYSQIPETDKNYLQYELTKLANIYHTDINLYDTTGNLIISSRPEIYDYKLKGEKMFPTSYSFLVNKHHLKFTTQEKIGTLEFMSTYVTITNNHNKILGYLNIPNFSNQEEYTKQFAGLIVAMLNIFVILLLIATFISVLIAKRITAPLTILQSKMKNVSIGTKNEKLYLDVPAELQALLENYNDMIDQLDTSANKLAKAERESAWREMARQIAHEIKNPLTPMKLSLQLLNRSWDEKDEKFEKRLKSISKTMIEQIDTLAETATSFSDFAKLSKITIEDVDINALLLNCVTLFNQEENVTITANLPNTAIIVHADKDKTMRVFNNLIKNAIQAIPSERHGEINITISEENGYAIITIQDNGRGISEENLQHIFELHFTTKSTGSGLGLAICKSIVEASNGKIWFETKLDEGTTFFIKLPC